MSKLGISKFFHTAKSAAIKHSPEILTGIGIAGMIATTVIAVRETPKALRLLEAARQEKGEDLTKREVVKTCWKCYIPAVVSGTVSAVCLIGANSVHMRRTAAMAAAYRISETALLDYKNKVVEQLGDKKEQAIRESIDKDRVEKNPVSKNEVIITEKGNTLCFDTISGRYFKSDIDKIKKAVNELNRKMVYETYVSLSEFYDELDLDHTSMSDDLGWNLDNGFVEVDFSSQIADDGTPCIVVNYMVSPRYDYYRFR